jgi:hypothetical protein
MVFLVGVVAAVRIHYPPNRGYGTTGWSTMPHVAGSNRISAHVAGSNRIGAHVVGSTVLHVAGSKRIGAHVVGSNRIGAACNSWSTLPHVAGPTMNHAT